jgi:hypothetical protein
MAMVLIQPEGVAGAWQAWRARRQAAAGSGHAAPARTKEA